MTPKSAETRVANMMIVAAERIEELSLEKRFFPFFTSRLNIAIV